MFENWRFTVALTLVAAVIGGVVALPTPGRAEPDAAPMALTAPVPSRTEPGPDSDLLEEHRSMCVDDLRSTSLLRRRAAALALRVLAAPETIPALRRAARARGNEPYLREVATALFVLKELEGETILLDLSRTGKDRYLAIAALGYGDGEASEARLREVLAGTERILAPAALTALVRRREVGWRDAIRKALTAKRWDLREAAVGALRSTRADVCGDELRSLLASESRGTALAAAEALSACGDGAAVAFLERLIGDADHRVRAEAARILIRAGDEGLFPVLERAYNEGSPTDRLALLARIAACPAPAFSRFLRDVMSRGPMVERVTAASALAAMGDRGAAAVLVEATECGNELLRARALIALSRLFGAGEGSEQ